jgi:hypothetical protein
MPKTTKAKKGEATTATKDVIQGNKGYDTGYPKVAAASYDAG